MTPQPTTAPETDLPNTAWATPQDLPVPRDDLLMEIDIYQDAIVLKAQRHSATFTRMVSADEIAAALTKHMGTNSGLLPQNTLWTSTGRMGKVTALWQQPRVWKAALQEKPFEPPTRFQLPMPGLVFICPPGQSPWVFAAKTRPTTPNDQLYYAPTFNVFQSGRVCPGSHTFPTDPSEVPESFFQSFFSPTGDTRDRSQNYPNDLRKLWSTLNGKRRYPLRDLVPAITTAQAMLLPEQTN